MIALDLGPIPGPRFQKGVSDRLRFWSRVKITDGCWEWDHPAPDGYAKIRISGTYRPAHRVAFEWAVGAVPVDHVLDHLCLNRACVRPDHLEPVTPRENTRRGMVKKNACVRGHDLTTSGSQYSNRSCRRCSDDRVSAVKRARRHGKAV